MSTVTVSISESNIVASIKEFETEFLEALLLQEIEEALEEEGPTFGELLEAEEEEELNKVMKYVGNLNFSYFAERVKREEHAQWIKEERKALSTQWVSDYKAKYES